jgi:hypothetical protein
MGGRVVVGFGGRFLATRQVKGKPWWWKDGVAGSDLAMLQAHWNWVAWPNV